jgi:hypothetical protein
LKPSETEGAWQAASEDHSMPDFQKLPDPFLYDTQALIRDLDSLRELILRIPVHNDTVLSANAAIGAVWDLRERLRFLAALQAESQRPWKRKHGEKRGHEVSTPATTARTEKRQARKVAAISGA